MRWVTSSTISLKPLFKWTGGKRKEIPLFAPYFPDFVTDDTPYRFVEPFVGAGAVFWYLANPNSVINDYDAEVMNFYEHVSTQDKKFLSEIAKVEKAFGKNGDRDKQAAAYYAARNLDRSPGLARLSPARRAARFFIVNQLAFSGMRRFNAAGQFNVPFGHYKTFNASALRDPAHAALLGSATICAGDYSVPLLANDNPNTFIFIDPPYTRVMKTYSAGNEFGEDAQRLLATRLIGMTHASWMVVIDKSELTMELYGDYVRHTYPLNYGVNIRNRFSQGAEHLVATNYVPAGPVQQALPGV